MIRLAFLLLGARELQPQWRLLAALGLVWMGIGVAILVDLSDGRILVALDALAILFAIEGVAELTSALLLGSRRSWRGAARGLAFLVVALLVFDIPWDNNIRSAVLFGSAFLFDGILRLSSAFVVHGRRWRATIPVGIVEIALAAVLLAHRPLPYRLTVPFCFAVMLLSSGFTLLRMGLQLRRLPPHASITALPFYAARNWHAHDALPGRSEDTPSLHAEPLRVHVWTAIGTAVDPQRRLMIDRYIAAVDRKGVISTGHSALELPPDLYISHYPAVEIDRNPQSFVDALNSGHRNDVPGRFQPSFAEETAGWCMPDSGVTFHRFDERTLRAFWHHYSTDGTYNLTGRNCSSTVIQALDAATEGVLGRGTPWRSFLHLLVNPTFWGLQVVRGRAEAMTWTPGLVLDYARLLRRVTEPGERGWGGRLWRARRTRRREPPLSARLVLLRGER